MGRGKARTTPVVTGKTVPTENAVRKTGSFFNNRKDASKPRTPSFDKKHATKLKSTLEKDKNSSTVQDIKNVRENVKQNNGALQAETRAVGDGKKDDQKLKDELKKLREEAALLRRKNEEAEQELRKRREETKARAAEKA